MLSYVEPEHTNILQYRLAASNLLEFAVFRVGKSEGKERQLQSMSSEGGENKTTDNSLRSARGEKSLRQLNKV